MTKTILALSLLFTSFSAFAADAEVEQLGFQMSAQFKVYKEIDASRVQAIYDLYRQSVSGLSKSQEWKDCMNEKEMSRNFVSAMMSLSGQSKSHILNQANRLNQLSRKSLSRATTSALYASAEQEALEAVAAIQQIRSGALYFSEMCENSTHP